MLSKDLEVSLNDAFQEARDNKHEFMTVEHLLLSLLDNPSAISVLQACGADQNVLRRDLTDFLEQTTPQLAANDQREIQPTLGFQRVLQRAVFHVQSSGRKEVLGANVLIALYGEKESQAVFFLQQQSISRLDIVNYVSHGISKYEDDDAESGDTDVSDIDPGEGGGDPLSKYTTNLNVLAQEGKIDPLIGRAAEVERIVQILCRRRKNNPLLVGEAGVGKTAIAEGLAKMIVEEEVPEVLSEAVVYCLDIGGLVAGTKYRGDFEKRLKGLLAQLKKEPNAVLFIDEIHTIIGAGSASGGVMDASNLIKPMLASGDLRCIGSTTYEEYRGIFEKDHALARRFQKIDVEEPSVEETFSILKGLKKHFEDHHGVRYTVPGLRAAAELSNRYITDRHLPDKAIDVIDEAGAHVRLLPPGKRKKTLGVGEIEAIVAKIARIPSQRVSRDDKRTLANLERDLKLVVYGQDPAVESLATAIKMTRAGLGSTQNPIGSFLFAGPTGVGKTEVTRQLAKILNIDLVRFDMSEYMERHTVSRLIGAPPGYVGFDQGGLLTEEINKHPHSVLLLDEVEKAHPDVFNLLLQVMDHGSLTDNNGRKTDFRNVILVMTTNAGADQMDRTAIGFTAQDESGDALLAVKKVFTPEFRNRLDSIIQFGHLSRDHIGHVVDKFLVELESQLLERKVDLQVDEVARVWLADRGYDKKMGARPMARVIQDNIKKLLADELLFGELARGGEVLVSVKDGELSMDIRSLAELEPA